MIFRMTGSGDTDGGNQRAVVETLDVSEGRRERRRPVVRLRADPRRGPARAPPTSVFAGYYLPGDPFGWVSISFTSE